MCYLTPVCWLFIDFWEIIFRQRRTRNTKLCTMASSRLFLNPPYCRRVCEWIHRQDSGGSDCVWQRNPRGCDGLQPAAETGGDKGSVGEEGGAAGGRTNHPRAHASHGEGSRKWGHHHRENVSQNFCQSFHQRGRSTSKELVCVFILLIFTMYLPFVGVDL